MSEIKRDDVKVGDVWMSVSDNSMTELLIVDEILHDSFRVRSNFDGEQYISSHDLITKYDLIIPAKFKGDEQKADMVSHPPHYKDASGIECIEVTKHMQFCGGNCFKYLYQAGKKGSTVEDLKKAVKYVDWAWEQEEVVLITPMRLIEQVAVHREGNIKEAMLYIAEDFWAMAKRSIETEIARLESE